MTIPLRGPINAILWAQWRSLRNYYPRGNMLSLVFAALMLALWYGLVVMGAGALAILVSNPSRNELWSGFLPRGLMLAIAYWQIAPLVLASTGASLDLKRIRAYPITHKQLFFIEVVLRLTTGVEMLILVSGASLGLLWNPSIPNWGPLFFVPFVLMNLFLSAGLRDLLGRLLARRGIRELAVVAMVILTGLPQLIRVVGVSPGAKSVLSQIRVDFAYTPWNAAATLVGGHFSIRAAAALLGYTLAAFLFGRWQFERGLRFDLDAAASAPASVVSRGGGSIGDYIFSLPSRIFRDPLGGLVEKELRSLTRAPRFRIVFFMGFSFGLLIWLPITYRSNFGGGALSSNYLTLVSAYALLLLGEVSFWNIFGFDRAAVQNYFVLPVPMRAVITAKNIAAFCFAFLEIGAIAAVCAVFGLAVSPGQLIETISVVTVMCVYLCAVGNLGSSYYPRPVNPTQSWKSASAGRLQALLLLIYPVLSIPVVLAFLARYAFESELAFYAVLSVGLAVGVAIYWVSRDSAIEALETRKEKFLGALTASEGPISA